MQNVTFDPERHEYRVNGVIVPSVTQILAGAGVSDYSNIPPEVLQRAAERGSLVHTYIEWYEDGTLDESSIDPALRGYFESYLRAKDAGLLPEKPSAVEKLVYSDMLSYAGTLDQLYDNDWINDIKTGRPQPEHELQVSAYWVALRGALFEHSRKLTDTYLHKDGTIADVVEQKYQPILWCDCVAIYDWKKKHGKIKND